MTKFHFGLLMSAAALSIGGTTTNLWAQDSLPRRDQKLHTFAGISPEHAPAPAFPEPVRAPAGAPNVLIIMTDDVGFAASSTFGGLIPTPTFDALAAQGLKFNQFNTAAICSPTRAALLTGRNPHQVNMAMTPEAASGQEGYTSVMPRSAATIAEVLKLNGYNTAMFGKWHLTPAGERSIAGPFDRWPTQMGFEHFYGFLGGEVNQFAPEIMQGTVPTHPGANDPGYHLERDLADHAVRWINQQESVAPDKPFLMYYASPTAHAPHQAPPAWLMRFRGKFDQGWDTAREQIFVRQKALGVIPAGAQLTPRSPGVPAWDTLTPEQKVVAARFMEAYAAALAYADHEIGRVIDALRTTGQLENTLIVFIQGDNGASALGGRYGSLNSEALYNLAVPPSFAEVAARVDEIGGPKAQSEFPLGWGHAMNTPFQYYKAVASHFGGIRNGMVISWPKMIKNPGGARTQFHFVSDVFPTILEAAKIPAPSVVAGVEQMPISGVSMLYTLNDPSAATTRKIQYFEAGQRVGMYNRGWFASAPLPSGVMAVDLPKTQLRKRKWELYKLDDDFSQASDLAAVQPDKLAELQDLFIAEGARNNVLPLNAFNPPALIAHLSTRKHFTLYPGTTGIPEASAPAMSSRSFNITADVEVPSDGAQGVLVTQGGRFVGFAFHLVGGKLAYTYNYFNMERATVVSRDPVPPGAHKLEVRFKYDGGGIGKGGLATLLIDGKRVGQGRVARTRSGMFQSLSESFDIGEDTGTPVADTYEVPNRFSGTLKRVMIDLE